VIQLPPKLYAQTSLSFALLVIRRNKPLERKNKVLFINAKNDFLPTRSQNVLRDQDIEKIVNAYREFKDKNGYCTVCSLDQIAKNQFHLDVPAYVVERSVEEMDLDIDASVKELEEIQKTKRDLYEHMRFNLERIIECGGRT
jgi:type I restriction enzyme M protein